MVIPSIQTSHVSLKLYHIFIFKALYCIPFVILFYFFFLRLRGCYCNVILLLLLFSASTYPPSHRSYREEKKNGCTIFRSSKSRRVMTKNDEAIECRFSIKILVEKFLTILPVTTLFLFFRYIYFEPNNEPRF